MKRLMLLVALMGMMAAGASAQVLITPAQIVAFSQQLNAPSNPPTGTYLTYINASGQLACLTPTGGSCLTSGGGVTSVTGTPPISSSGGNTPAISCPTCAIGPGSSTANHIAEFSGTDGLTLIDGGAAPVTAAPIFSTAVTGTSMVTAGTNTALVGPVSMTTPGVAGSYRFELQVLQTTLGSGGTCTAGTILISLGFKDADTSVTYAPLASLANILLYPFGNNPSSTFAPVMAGGANGTGNNWNSIPRTFRAASGTVIQYEVFQGTNSNCTTPPVFAVRPALYSLGY